MPRLRDLVRNPASTVTGAVDPPRPGTKAFALWNRVTRLNVAAYRATGGRIGGRLDGVPILLLHHVGRKSGEHRVTPLLHLRDGDDLVIVASMGGTPKHPAWFHNLMARPETEVEVGREVRHVRAREAGAQERERLWPELIAAYPAFDAYRRRAEREIPIVVLERIH